MIQNSKGFALPVALTFRHTGNVLKIRNEHLNMTQAHVHKPSNLLVQGKRATLGFLLITIPVDRKRIGEGTFIVKNGMGHPESVEQRYVQRQVVLAAAVDNGNVRIQASELVCEIGKDGCLGFPFDEYNLLGKEDLAGTGINADQPI